MYLIFAKNFYHGSKKKFKRLILDIILYFCCGFSICHCNALALVNADTAFCYYFLCVGDGYYLTPTGLCWKLNKKSKLTIVEILQNACRIFLFKYVLQKNSMP